MTSNSHFHQIVANATFSKDKIRSNYLDLNYKYNSTNLEQKNEYQVKTRFQP